MHEKAFENVVCEMVAILPRERWVNIIFRNNLGLYGIYPQNSSQNKFHDIFANNISQLPKRLWIFYKWNC